MITLEQFIEKLFSSAGNREICVYEYDTDVVDYGGMGNDEEREHFMFSFRCGDYRPSRYLKERYANAEIVEIFNIDRQKICLAVRAEEGECMSS